MNLRRVKWHYVITLLLIILFVILGLLRVKAVVNTQISGREQQPPENIPSVEFYTDDELVRAIYLAEGGSKARYLYGIRSVKYSSKAKARQACLETVQKNRRKWAEAGYLGDFIDYLHKIYAPPEAHPLNKYWARNVRYFLEKGQRCEMAG